MIQEYFKYYLLFYERQILQKFLKILKLKSNIQASRADVPMFYSLILCKFHDFTHKICNFRQKLEKKLLELIRKETI